MASKMSIMMKMHMVHSTVCPDKMNKNAMLPHNFIRYKLKCLQLVLPGLKIKDGFQDGCQNKIF